MIAHSSALCLVSVLTRCEKVEVGTVGGDDGGDDDDDDDDANGDGPVNVDDNSHLSAVFEPV